MRNSFDTKDYLAGLGTELVNAFDLAGKTTHPLAVGSGREKSAKEKLRRCLPIGVGVGSGFVFDSYGNTSGECDIILYEEQFALKFSINDDDRYSYYNCESVIAVGQVKSDAQIGDVRDSISNLRKIRELIRRQQQCSGLFVEDKTSVFRPYLSMSEIEGTKDEEYNPEINAYDQIYTFLICKSFKTPAESILSEIKTLCNNERKLYPNRLLSVDGYYCFWLHTSNNAYCVSSSALNSTGFTRQEVECAFGQLMKELTDFICKGRSVPIQNGIYFPNLYGLPLNEPVLPV